jgi:hypothetical protein
MALLSPNKYAETLGCATESRLTRGRATYARCTGATDGGAGESVLRLAPGEKITHVIDYFVPTMLRSEWTRVGG